MGGRLQEISENLHRADLTTLQRNEQIAEWIRLTEAQVSSEKLAQSEPVSKGGRGKAGGVRAATRELGIVRNEAQRALKIAGITPEAKEAARAAGLENHQNALLKVAQAEPERQARSRAGARYLLTSGPVLSAGRSCCLRIERRGSSSLRPSARPGRARTTPLRPLPTSADNRASLSISQPRVCPWRCRALAPGRSLPATVPAELPKAGRR